MYVDDVNEPEMAVGEPVVLRSPGPLSADGIRGRRAGEAVIFSSREALALQAVAL